MFCPPGLPEWWLCLPDPVGQWPCPLALGSRLAPEALGGSSWAREPREVASASEAEGAALPECALGLWSQWQYC